MTEQEMKKWFENCNKFERVNGMGDYAEEMYQAFKARFKSECTLNIFPEDK